MYRKGFTLIEAILIVVVATLVILVFSMGLSPHLSMRPISPRGSSAKVSCSSNLKQIHTGMFAYSQDYKGMFPSVSMKGTIIGEDKAKKNLKPGLPDDPFKDFSARADHSVSENVWLLCRTDFAVPDKFICPVAPEGKAQVDLKDGAGTGANYFVNYPWKDPGVTLSYSFIQPWTQFGDKGNCDTWSADNDPRLVIGADANNNIQPNYKCKINPLSDDEMKKYVNSTNHKGEGQNCLFGDGHVQLMKSSYVGIDLDNIYTALPTKESGKTGETSGVLSVRPKDVNDTVLIPNKDADLAKWNRKP